MHEWLVGGAVIESSVLADRAHNTPGLLLVQNVRRGGVVDWTPPGGVIDAGESLVAGLTREVAEETGLSVTRWSGPLYEISARAPDLGWHLRVEVHRALEVGGEVHTGSDPDGIVTEAALVPEGECEGRLCDAHPWVREPLVDWMRLRWSETRSYHYLVEGAELSELRITQLDVPK
ncbi:MAG: NUDIX hydrolase [Microthrixaceae bacterium]